MAGSSSEKDAIVSPGEPGAMTTGRADDEAPALQPVVVVVAVVEVGRRVVGEGERVLVRGEVLGAACVVTEAGPCLWVDVATVEVGWVEVGWVEVAIVVEVAWVVVGWVEVEDIVEACVVGRGVEVWRVED